MMDNDLLNKRILITGGARRIGKELVLACAQSGASIILHHSSSDDEASDTAHQARQYGVNVEIIKADFSNPVESIQLFEKYLENDKSLYGLVNNASIFEPIKFADTTITSWQAHLNINLTMPFLLSQLLQRKIGNKLGRIVNILDWRALRPGKDHFPYTISKAALSSMTKSLALALSPNISVNGIALGAILPPSDNSDTSDIIKSVPAGRWASMRELSDTVLFLLSGPQYITGEIIHLDGGRHLV